ncbi:MAG: hypothetical protein HY606_12755, partial [Planctomycetes bacterium]|nr:hypothetical protein [Planctomycetota bacterium]
MSKSVIFYLSSLAISATLASGVTNYVNSSKQSRESSKSGYTEGITMSVVETDLFERYVANGDIGGLLNHYKNNILIAEGSELIYLKENIYELKTGAAIFHIPKESKSTISVITPHGIVKSKGTIFQLTGMTMPFPAIFISVISGSVQFKNEILNEMVDENEVMLTIKEQVIFKKKIGELKEKKAVDTTNDHTVAPDREQNSQIISLQGALTSVTQAISGGTANKEMLGLMEKIMNLDWITLHEANKQIDALVDKFQKKEITGEQLDQEIKRKGNIALHLEGIGRVLELEGQGLARESIFVAFALKEALSAGTSTTPFETAFSNLKQIASTDATLIEKTIRENEYISDFLNNTPDINANILEMYNTGELNQSNYAPRSWIDQISSTLKDDLGATNEQVSGIENNVNLFVERVAKSGSRTEAYKIGLDFIYSLSHRLNPDQITKFK